MTTIDGRANGETDRGGRTSYTLTGKLANEFAGAFALMFAIGEAGNPANRLASGLTPVAAGLTLTILVYVGGPISGGHYNPAVSTAVYLCRRLKASEYGAYVLAQVSGAALAGLLVLALDGHLGPGATGSTDKMLIAEAIFTFALTYVVLSVTAVEPAESRSYSGLAVGSVVLVGGISVGWVSGGAFNPAVALGATIVGEFTWSHLWI